MILSKYLTPIRAEKTLISQELFVVTYVLFPENIHIFL